MDFVVIINIAEEGEYQLKLVLENIRQHYNETVVPIHVISDGVENPEYGEIAGSYGAQYTAGCYLKRAECGGMWWQRTLNIGRSYNKKWILKMDPDARFVRCFSTEPRYALSGTLLNAVTYTQIIKEKTDVRDERLRGRSERVSSLSIRSAIPVVDHFCGRGSHQSGQSCATNHWR